MDAALDSGDEVLGGGRTGEPQHRQHDGQGILGAMIDLARQQHLALLGAFAVGDVEGDAVHAYRLALGVARDDAGAIAPAHFAARSHDPEFDLEARLAQTDDGGERVLLAVVGMHHRLDALDRGLEMSRIDAEDAVRAVIPFEMTRHQVDLPRAHVAGRERDGAALLALAQALGLRLELGGARGDALLQLGIQHLELAGLAVEIDEDPHLGAQHLGHDRHRHVVDGADFVAAQVVHLADLDGRDEDDGELLEARMLADHGGKLEAVELRHHHVDQHDRHVLGLEQDTERLVRRGRLDQVLAQLGEDDLVAQKLRRLIVDQQDVDLVHGDRSVRRTQRCSQSRSAEKSCSVLTGLAR